MFKGTLKEVMEHTYDSYESIQMLLEAVAEGATLEEAVLGHAEAIIKLGDNLYLEYSDVEGDLHFCPKCFAYVEADDMHFTFKSVSYYQVYPMMGTYKVGARLSEDEKYFDSPYECSQCGETFAHFRTTDELRDDIENAEAIAERKAAAYVKIVNEQVDDIIKANAPKCEHTNLVQGFSDKGGIPRVECSDCGEILAEDTDLDVFIRATRPKRPLFRRIPLSFDINGGFIPKYCKGCEYVGTKEHSAHNDRWTSHTCCVSNCRNYEFNSSLKEDE